MVKIMEINNEAAEQILNNGNNENGHIIPRSVRSDEKAYLRFINLTNRTVEIVWIDFTGQYIRYYLLRNYCYIDIDTYKTHPWIALDVYTKDRMLIDKQYIFMPKTYREYMINAQPNMIHPVVPVDRRKVICITLPLYSLRYRCLLAVRNHLGDVNELENLDLPRPLLEDLKKVIKLRNTTVTYNRTE